MSSERFLTLARMARCYAVEDTPDDKWRWSFAVTTAEPNSIAGMQADWDAGIKTALAELDEDEDAVRVCIALKDKAQARRAAAEAEVERLRGGPEGPWPSCRDCGRAMVWSRDAGVWMCPRHTHARMETAERLVRERDAEVARLRRYEALGEAWLAHAQCVERQSEHNAPPRLVPIEVGGESPERRKWRTEAERLARETRSAWDARDKAGAALAAEGAK